MPLLLVGCSLLPTTRKLPIPKAPAIVRTAKPEELVAQLNQRWESVTTLTATVEMQASEVKTKEGLEKGSPTLHGHILMRKPAMLRVVAQYLGIRFINMASDGDEFTLSIPPLKKAIKGSNAMKKKSAVAWENLRPKFFFDAMLVRGLESDDFYSVTADTVTAEDKERKHLFLVPEYMLSIRRHKAGSREEVPVRTVYFHRDDLEPYQQDIYDSEGNLETQVFYSAYQDFDSLLYPSSIVIKRPLEEIQIVLTIDDVKENQELKDDQFVVTIPEGTKIEKRE